MNIGRWVTINGVHIYIKNGQSPMDAFIRRESSYGKGLSANEKSTKENHPKPILIETININDEKEIYNTLEKYEKIIKNDKIENAIVITKAGKVYQCFGNENNVWPDLDLDRELFESYITHNHLKTKTKFSFSEDDRELFLKYNIKVLRGKDYKYTYELNKNIEFKESMPSFDYVPIDDEDGYHLMNILYSYQNNIGYKRWKND